MKLYQSVGPNPRVVLMYIEEKGLTVDRQWIDLMGGENRRAPYTDMAPFGQLPLLETDDGAHIFESIAICEYLEEVEPEPPLIGSTPQERAETRMLIRRVDYDVVMPMTTGFRASEGKALFASRMRLVEAGAGELKACARDGLEEFDKWLANREWLAGERFTLADIVLYCFVDFGGLVGQPLPEGLSNVAAWKDRVAARPSAAASADDKAGVAA